MASENTPSTTSTNQPIGSALIVYGSVKAESQEGTTRTIQPNSQIFANDRVITGNNGMVSIVFNDAAKTQLDLGRMSDVLIDEEVFQPYAPEDLSEAAAEVQDIQEALIAGEFDPTVELEAPAAGAPAAGAVADAGGGSSFVKFDLTAEEVTPESGAETTGIDYNFLQSEPDVLEPIPEIPVAPVTTVAAATFAAPVPADTPIIPPPPPPPTPFTPTPIARVVEEEAIEYETQLADAAFPLFLWFSSDGNPDDIKAPDTSTPEDIPEDPFQPDSEILTGTLAGALTSGPATFSLISTANLPTLWSQGQEVEYYLDPNGQFIIAGIGITGGGDFPEIERPVFSLEVTADGEYRYIQYDQLDHTPNDLSNNPAPDENIELQSGLNQLSSVNGLDFSGSLQAVQGGVPTTFPDGLFVFTVVDDIPIAIDPGENAIFETVLEDGLNQQVVPDLNEGDVFLQNPDSSLGNRESGEGIDSDEASGNIYSQNSIANLFKVGADEFPNFQSEGPSPEALYGITTDINLLNGLPTLFSHDTQIQYSSDGQTLTATAGDTVIFTFRIDPNTGTWRFDLEDQLDHVAGNGENLDLKTSIDDSTPSISGIDFSSILTAADYDNDKITGAAPGSFIIAIQDDIPVAINQPTAIEAQVEEDGMSLVAGDLSEGNKDAGDSNTDDEDAGSGATSVATLFSIGADEDLAPTATPIVNYGFVSDVSGLDSLGLTSKGEAVTFTSDGQTLTGSAGGREILTVEIKAATGNWEVDLKDQFDHVGPQEPGVENSDLISSSGPLSSIDLSSYLTATDFDGDTVAGAAQGSFTLTIEDDIPKAVTQPTAIAASVEEDGMSLGTGDLSEGNKDAGDSNTDDEDAGSGATSVATLFTVGADEDFDPAATAVVNYGFATDVSGLDSLGLTSKGEAVTFTSDGQTLTGSAGGREILTVEIKAATGNWEVDLKDQFDHVGPQEPGVENSDLVSSSGPLSAIDLSSYLTATDFDGDTVTGAAQGSFTLAIEDDIPKAVTQPTAIAASVEEDGMSLGTGDLSEGNKDAGDSNTDDEDAGSGATSVATLFTIGADEDFDPAATPVVSYGFATDVSGLDSLGLTSKGEAVTFTSDGQTLSGSAGGREILTVEIKAATGNWEVDLKDQFDHVGPQEPGVENSDLVSSSGPLSSIDLSSYLTATDFDGDTVTGAAQGSFTLAIEDDIPKAVTQPTAIAASVEEDGMSLGTGDLSEGNKDAGDSNTDDEDAISGATSVATLFTIGADEDFDPAATPVVSYGFATDVSGLDSLGLTSKGEAVTFTSDGQTLSGSAGGREILTVEIKAATGNWEVDLKDQFDHVGPQEPGVENSDLVSSSGPLSAIDLSSYLTATDFDGDTVTGAAQGSFTLAIEDDIPKAVTQPTAIAASVEEDGMSLGTGDLSEGNKDAGDSNTDDEDAGSGATSVATLFTVGADEDFDPAATPVVSYGFATDVSGLDSLGLTSKGEAVTFTSDGQTLTGSAGGREILTVEIKAATGNWEVDLKDQFDHVGPQEPGAENSDLISSSGPLSAIDLSSYLTATDFDGDTVTGAAQGSFTLAIEDDIPKAVSQPTAIAASVEEDGMSLGTGDLSEGNKDASDSNTDDEDAGSGATSVATLFTIGADEDFDPAATPVVSYGFATDVSGLDSLGLTSKGEAVTFTSDGQTLTGSAGGREILTVEIKAATGNWEVDLKDQFDHVGPQEPGVENSDLISSSGPLSSIDLSSYLTATDFDGDTVTGAAQGSFTLAIEDDIPKAVTQPTAIAASVEEDGMSLGTGDLSEGNKDAGDSNTDDEDAGSGATSVATLFTIGADEDFDPAATPVVSYGFATDVSGLDSLGLTSKGEAVTFTSDGQTLSGSAGGREILTVEIKAATGNWEVDLKDQFDHVGPQEPGVENSDLVSSSGPLSAIDLSSYLTATDFDGDTVTGAAQGSFTLAIEDDIPKAVTQPTAIAASVEEDGMSLGTGDLSEGNKDAGDSSTDDEDAGSGATSVATLFTVGADEDFDPAATPVVSYGFATDVSGLDSLGLTSKGEAVTFTSDGQTLTGSAGGREILTVEIKAATGNWEVDLKDQFDHVGPQEPGVENSDLVSSSGPLSAIDLSSYLTATDFDGDTVTGAAQGSFTLTIEDDIPKAVSQPTAITASVEEDGMSLGTGDLSEGNKDAGDSNTDDEDAGSGATSVATLFTVGADEDFDPAATPVVSYGFATDVSGLDSLGLTSKGEAVTFTSDGQTLTGSAGGREILTVEIKSATGNWEVDLKDQFDHIGPQEPGVENSDLISSSGPLSAIDLSSYLTATDFDGDTVTGAAQGSFALTIEDDIPKFNGELLNHQVEEEGLHNFDSAYTGPGVEGSEGNEDETGATEFDGDPNLTTATGSLSTIITSGADEDLTYSFVDDVQDALADANPGLTSNGATVTYSVDNNTNTLIAEAEGRTVFTLNLDEDTGDYDFELLDQLDHDPPAPGTAVENSLTLNLGASIQAEDADGDTVNFGSVPVGDQTQDGLSIEVADDIPEAVETQVVPGNMNLVLILDNSGSMYSNEINWQGSTTPRIDAMQASVVALLTGLAADGVAGSTYKVHLVEYNTDSSSLGTFTITGGDTSSAQAAIDAVNGMVQPDPLSGDQFTNYEAGYQQALDWINNGDPLTDADVTGALVNEVLFISDGDPNRWNDPDYDEPGGPVVQGSGGGFNTDALNQVTGSDGSNEVEDLGDWADNVRAIGIQVTDNQDDRLDTLDLTGDALNITSGDQLLAILPQLLELPLPIITASVEEDDLTVDGDNVLDPDSSTGINEDGSTNADEDFGSSVSTDATNISNLFTAGADEDLSFKLSDNIGGIPTLYSNGEALTYDVVGNVLTGTAGGETIFTFTVNTDGSWIFDLDGQLDHVAGDGENYDLRTGDGTAEVGGIDLSSIIIATDADGDEVLADTGAFVVMIQDDVPVVGTPQDSLLAIEQGNSLTASLDIVGSGADDPLSISLMLVEGEDVLSIGGSHFTGGGDPLFWLDNGDGSWSAVSKDGSGNLDSASKFFTVSVDEAAGTYTVTQDGDLDGASSVKTIDFSDALNGGNTYEAVFGSGGTSSTVGDVTTYSNGVFVWARASQNLSDPFGWDGSSDSWTNDSETVNYANQGVGVGGGSMINGVTTGGDRASDILSFKFFSEVEVDNSGNNQESVRLNQTNSSVLDLSAVTLVLDHLGTAEKAFYTLWNDGKQVSGEVSISNSASSNKGGNSSDDFILSIDGSSLNTGETVFDEIRLEAGTVAGKGAPNSSDFRIQSAEIEIFQEGVDESILIPVEIADADGDVIETDFSVTFDGNTTLNAEDADAADGDVSTSGMVISGSSNSETITGTDYDDTIDGGAGEDNIAGGDGADTIYGGAGNDFLAGGEGNDYLVGDIDDDLIFGGEGDDELLGGAGEDQIIGGEGSDIIDGGDGDDILVGDDVEFGATPDDTVIVEDEAADTIVGGDDIDTGGDVAATNPVNDDTLDTEATMDDTDIDNLVPPPDPSVV
ncbi:retention module-containing protein [Desulfosediminicola flagellatus]|uniref:retention module-containing protein n=1 Tax=Desulfosediminicola flagellatus TaxID=2569541 RepID=UPI00142EE6A6|nr:retention module-containing protein [Desulfosediminicola flagellatus]